MSIEKEIKKQEQIAEIEKVNAEHKHDLTAEQDMREAFSAEEEQGRLKSFWNKMSDIDLAYKKVYSEGIEDGDYKLKLVDINLSKSKSPNGQIIAKWQMEESYIVDDVELRNLKFTTFSVNEFFNGITSNPVLSLLKGIYKAYQLKEPEVFTVEELVRTVQKEVVENKDQKAIMARVTSRRSGSGAFNQVAL